MSGPPRKDAKPRLRRAGHFTRKDDLELEALQREQEEAEPKPPCRCAEKKSCLRHRVWIPRVCNDVTCVIKGPHFPH